MENFIRIVLEQLNRIEDSLTNNKQLLNVDELSKFTGISKSTIYKLTSSKDIPHIKKAKNLIFDREEIIKWLKSSRVSSLEEIDRAANNFISQNRT